MPWLGWWGVVGVWCGVGGGEERVELVRQWRAHSVACSSVLPFYRRTEDLGVVVSVEFGERAGEPWRFRGKEPVLCVGWARRGWKGWKGVCLCV